jgi:ABC-type transport system involved in multi-copper enzyme maturation permease subunit
MPIESYDFQTFAEWFPGAFAYWAAVMGCLLVGGLITGFFVSVLRSGPMRAVEVVGRAVRDLVLDMTLLSPRRILALAWVAVKEAVRRRVLVVFALFLVLMLFAGWFINTASDHPERVCIGRLVFPAMWVLTFLLGLFLSSMSLPLDIKNRTLHTVVTKPVRQSEIVLGRILGFAAVGTLLLAAMGVIGWLFTIRTLSHTHTLTAGQLKEETTPGSQTSLLKGKTSAASGHQHAVTIDASGEAVVEMKQGHTHDLYIEGEGDDATYTLEGPKDQLVARVPIYGKLHFLDRAGNEAEKGVNTGDEWTYRSFIEGAGRMAAIWEFKGITQRAFPESEFPESIPLDLTIEVFRTHKGDVSKAVAGGLWLRNPDTGLKVEAQVFGAKKFSRDVRPIPRSIEVFKKDAKGKPVKDANGRPVRETYDLFRDLVTPDGRVEVWLQCLEGGQYFGMARADAYFHARDASFVLNFVKGLLGIWMQMALVIGFGVMLSTFLSAPVALLATVFVIVGGIFRDFIVDLAAGKTYGGGPWESAIRLFTQQNQIVELEPGLRTSAALTFDTIAKPALWMISRVLPAFGNFEFDDYVSYGYAVDGDLLLRCAFQLIGFLLPLTVAGYFFLKNREVAR